MCKFTLYISIFICLYQTSQEYKIPEPTVQLLYPKGFSVSIPDEPGIKQFRILLYVNKKLVEGHYEHPESGKWTFTDKETKFQIRNALYFRCIVDFFDGRQTHSYSDKNRKLVVTDCPRNMSSELGFCIAQDAGDFEFSDSLIAIFGGEFFIRTQDQETYTGSYPQYSLAAPTTWCPDMLTHECKGKLIFHEEFDFLNTSNWTRDIRFADDPDYEFVIYDSLDKNLYIKNGKLHIKPTLTDDTYGQEFVYSREGYDLGHRCTPRPNTFYDCKRKSSGGYILPPVSSARLKSSITFKYGRIDIRAKLPKGDWIYPQLSLSPSQYEYGAKNYDSGEIRIAFIGGNSKLNTQLQSGILLGTSASARAFNIKTLTRPNQNWSDDYHVYSTIWRPDSITFLVDNVRYGDILPSTEGFANVFREEKPETVAKWKAGGIIAPFDKEMFLNIGVGVGGHSFPDTISGKPYTNVEPKAQTKFYRARNIWKPSWNEDSELIVDYIKIFSL